MKRRIVLACATAIVVLAALVPLGSAVADLRPRPGAEQAISEKPSVMAPAQTGPEAGDQSELLNYPYPVHIEELTGPERTDALLMLMYRPETVALRTEMLSKGFYFNEASPDADVMRISIEVDGVGTTTVVTATTMMATGTTSETQELSGALTAMVADDDTGFFQAHHTNLDPRLADVPDPPIVVNGMPYFYVTTLRWINGRIIYWRYWWYDSHHHPNWYYAHYYWYWWYYDWYTVDWPYWYGWVHGWYYWRYWYYWSTWFPW